ncbi:MAG: hypothetical protein M1561_02000 [Gammaproteobacteria bacterium]|nr:hypothetical protein [Gammaproteobacteria bacterium]
MATTHNRATAGVLPLEQKAERRIDKIRDDIELTLRQITDTRDGPLPDPDVFFSPERSRQYQIRLASLLRELAMHSAYPVNQMLYSPWLNRGNSHVSAELQAEHKRVCAAHHQKMSQDRAWMDETHFQTLCQAFGRHGVITGAVYDRNGTPTQHAPQVAFKNSEDPNAFVWTIENFGFGHWQFNEATLRDGNCLPNGVAQALVSERYAGQLSRLNPNALSASQREWLAAWNDEQNRLKQIVRNSRAQPGPTQQSVAHEAAAFRGLTADAQNTATQLRIDALRVAADIDVSPINLKERLESMGSDEIIAHQIELGLGRAADKPSGKSDLDYLIEKEQEYLQDKKPEVQQQIIGDLIEAIRLAEGEQLQALQKQFNEQDAAEAQYTPSRTM